MEAKRLKLRVGDVVGIPVGDDSWALAQLTAIHARHELFFVVYAGAHPLEQASAIVESGGLPDDVELVSATTDARIYHGYWPVLGRSDQLRRDVLPAYVVDTDDGWVVEDAEEKRRRRASFLERRRLPLRTSVSPMLLEQAVKALHGERAWDDDFDELRVPPARARAATIFGGE